MAWTERYVSVAGGGAHDGTSEANAWTLAEAIAAPYAAGQRINVKAGTYANTTTTRTFGVAGTTTAPIWWRGYNATIGDLDSDFATAKPAITFTTGVFDCTGSFHLFSNLDISGAQTTAAQFRTRTGTNNYIDRCRIECTSASANGRALSLSSRSGITRSWLKCTSSANVIDAGAADLYIAGNALINGASGVAISGAQRVTIAFNTFVDQGADGINCPSGAMLWILSNSFYSPASDGIDFNTAMAIAGVIANNIFSECGGYGINNSTAANTATILRLHNDFYNNTSGNENGFGDFPSLGEQTESSSPFLSATDLSLIAGRNAIANGFPGLFENQTYTSYLDIGAVQKLGTGGGGTPRLIDKGLIIS